MKTHDEIIVEINQLKERVNGYLAAIQALEWAATETPVTNQEDEPSDGTGGADEREREAP